MYEAHWGLSQSPFPVELDARFYFESESVTEAMARVRFALHNQYRVLIVRGDHGVGKSTFLQQVGKRYDRPERQIATLSLLGIEPEEFLLELSTQLGESAVPRRSQAWLWRRLRDRIRLNTQQRIQTVLLLDDAAEAEHEVLNTILRLANGDLNSESSLSIVVAAQEDRTALLGQRLLDLAQLRIDIDAWTYDDTAEYIRQAVAAVGGSATLFDDGALRSLHELSRGNPRRVRQLAELTLIAGAGAQVSEVAPELVHAVNDELAC